MAALADGSLTAAAYVTRNLLLGTRTVSVAALGAVAGNCLGHLLWPCWLG